MQEENEYDNIELEGEVAEDPFHPDEEFVQDDRQTLLSRYKEKRRRRNRLYFYSVSFGLFLVFGISFAVGWGSIYWKSCTPPPQGADADFALRPYPPDLEVLKMAGQYFNLRNDTFDYYYGKDTEWVRRLLFHGLHELFRNAEFGPYSANRTFQEYARIHADLTVYDFRRPDWSVTKPLLGWRVLLERVSSLAFLRNDVMSLISAYLNLNGDLHYQGAPIEFTSIHPSGPMYNKKTGLRNILGVNSELKTMLRLRAKFLPFLPYPLQSDRVKFTVDFDEASNHLRELVAAQHRLGDFSWSEGFSRWFYYFLTVLRFASEKSVARSPCLYNTPGEERLVVSEANCTRNAFARLLEGAGRREVDTSALTLDIESIRAFMAVVSNRRSQVPLDALFQHYFNFPVQQASPLDQLQKFMLHVTDYYCSRYLFRIFELHYSIFSSTYTANVRLWLSRVRLAAKGDRVRSWAVAFDDITRPPFLLNSRLLLGGVNSCIDFYEDLEEVLFV